MFVFCKCLKIFHWKPPAGQAVHNAADLQVPGLENFCYSQFPFDVLIQFRFVLKLFLGDKLLFFCLRIPPEDLFVADIDKRRLVLDMVLELLDEFEKLVLNGYICGQAMDFDRIQLCCQHLFFIRIQVGIRPPSGFYFFMPQTLGDHQDIKSHFYQYGSKGVPLRYNNDKRKKPLFSRSPRVCRHLFNSFSKLKFDEKIIKKRRLFH